MCWHLKWKVKFNANANKGKLDIDLYNTVYFEFCYVPNNDTFVWLFNITDYFSPDISQVPYVLGSVELDGIYKCCTSVSQ